MQEVGDRRARKAKNNDPYQGPNNGKQFCRVIRVGCSESRPGKSQNEQSKDGNQKADQSKSGEICKIILEKAHG